MAGVKTASVAQLEHQIVYNDAELRGKLEFMALAPTHPLTAQYRQRCQILRTMIEKCRQEYRLRTGKDYPYVMPMMPMIVKANPQKVQNQVSNEQVLTESRQLRDLIELGTRDLFLLQNQINSWYKVAHESGFSNLLFSHWVRIFSAANPRTLVVLRDMSVPGISKLLNEAEAARKSGDLDTARQKIYSAAIEMERVHNEFESFQNRIESGAKQAEIAITFYAAVAAGGAVGAYNTVNATALTVGQQAAVGTVGKGAEKVTELITKGVGGESVTPKDLAEATYEVALAGGSPLFGHQVEKYMAGMAKHLAARIAAKAVDRYMGSTLGHSLTHNSTL